MSANTEPTKAPNGPHRIKDQLRPRVLLPNLAAGTVVGIIQISTCLSFAAMIFAGSLGPWVSLGISGMLVGGLILNLFAAFGSSAPGISAAPQDGPTAVAAVIAASIAGSLAGQAAAREAAVTVVAAVTVSALLTGFLFLLCGRLRIGGLVRYIPYPVIGGFLAGTGWLLFLGGLKVMTDGPISLDQLGGLFRGDMLIKWLPGAVLGGLIFLIRRRSDHYLILPVMLVAAAGLFYGALLVYGTPVAQVRVQGLLLTGIPKGVLFQPLGPSDLGLVRWSSLILEAGGLATVVVLSLVQFLLYVSGLEVSINRDLDLDRELRVAGAANLVGGLFGSVPGYPWPSTSILAHRMGARSRLVGVFSAALFGVSILAGAAFLPYFPKLLLGGILVYLGLAFLGEWVYDARAKLPRNDYLIVLLILAVIATVGFLEGVGVGLAGAVFLFVIKYSRVRVVKLAMSGGDLRSNRDRAAWQMKTLEDNGDQAYVIKLEGFIFFGTANSLLQEIRSRVENTEKRRLKYALVDFRQVSGFDSSALLSFTKMQQLATTNGIHLVFTQIKPEFERQIIKLGFEPGGKEGLSHLFPDLDHGMEWVEERVLAEVGTAFFEEKVSIEDCLRDYTKSPRILQQLKAYFERLDLEGNHYLVHQGQLSRELYLVEDGSVTVVLELADGQKTRLRTMGPGTVVGETSLYMGTPRTASVITDGPATVYRLTEDALSRMQKQDPEAAQAFHHFLVHRLTERLIYADRILELLLR